MNYGSGSETLSTGDDKFFYGFSFRYQQAVCLVAVSAVVQMLAEVPWLLAQVVLYVRQVPVWDYYLSVGMLHRILILPGIMCGRIAGIVFTSTQFCFVRKNSTSSSSLNNIFVLFKAFSRFKKFMTAVYKDPVAFSWISGFF